LRLTDVNEERNRSEHRNGQDKFFIHRRDLSRMGRYRVDRKNQRIKT
jgi:hypothetical protein